MIATALAAAALASGPSGTAVGIDLGEWYVVPGRRRAPIGRVRFNIENLGEDGHDFGVRNRSGQLLKKIDELPSGGRTTMRYRFRKTGRYALVCVLDGHEDVGMVSSLRVFRPDRRR